MPSGVSHFVEVYNVMYGSQAIYGVSNIKINRKNTILKGRDNNKLRIVSTHKVAVEETITMDMEDVAAIKALLPSNGASDLTFTWKAAGQTLSSGALANQSVTIKNVVLESVNVDAPDKQFGKGQVQGCVLETSDATDPVVFA